MKQKLGFPGMLLPFGKDKNTKRRRAIYKLIAAKFREKVSYIDHYYIAIIIVLAALIILAWSISGYGQTPTAAENDSHTSYLKVGDKMPDAVISGIINSKMKTAKISDYKGKLIILDFWSTWCSSCVAAFPELDSLQRAFPGKIQIFLVNSKKQNDTEKGVKIVIDRVNDWSSHRLKLPVVFADTALTQYFRFRVIPNCVWIGPTGVVLAITGKEEVSSENISRFLKGEKLHLPLKDDYKH